MEKTHIPKVTDSSILQLAFGQLSLKRAILYYRILSLRSRYACRALNFPNGSLRYPHIHRRYALILIQMR